MQASMRRSVEAAESERVQSIRQREQRVSCSFETVHLNGVLLDIFIA